jgi:Cu+-exporting ATPase
MAAVPGTSSVELDLEGMTCAACATRIETQLNKLEGVEASVQFAPQKVDVAARATAGYIVAGARGRGPTPGGGVSPPAPPGAGARG